MKFVFVFCLHEQSAQEKEEHVTNATSDVAEEAKGKVSEAKDKAKGNAKTRPSGHTPTIPSSTWN